MSPSTNNWRKRRTKHRFYAEIVADITTQNSERLSELQFLSVHLIVLGIYTKHVRSYDYRKCGRLFILYSL